MVTMPAQGSSVEVEAIAQWELQFHVPEPDLAEDVSGQVAAALGWLGDEFYASPRLEDLLRVSVLRLGSEDGPVFDSVRDTTTPLEDPLRLVAGPTRTASASPATLPQDRLALVVTPTASWLEHAEVAASRRVHGGTTRIVWMIGKDNDNVLASAHSAWGASLTVADDSMSSRHLITVCAEFVRHLLHGGTDIAACSSSAALRAALEGVGYVAG